MADSIDWTDETLRPLDELARLAFPPSAGVTAGTLKRRARQGKLVVYRPGKFYMSSFAGIRAMVEATRVQPKPQPPPAVLWKRRDPPTHNPLGLNEQELAKFRLDRLLAKLDWRNDPARIEMKRLRDEERAKAAPAHRLKMKEQRKKRARERYREMKEERLKAEQK